MTRALVLTPEAERDIVDAQNWYDHHRPGLGAEFLDAVDSTINVIRQEPMRHQIVWRRFRRARFRRFPYGLIYAVSDREIIVLACFHARRNSNVWKERARS